MHRTFALRDAVEFLTAAAVWFALLAFAGSEFIVFSPAAIGLYLYLRGSRQAGSDLLGCIGALILVIGTILGCVLFYFVK